MHGQMGDYASDDQIGEILQQVQSKNSKSDLVVTHKGLLLRGNLCRFSRQAQATPISLSRSRMTLFYFLCLLFSVYLFGLHFYLSLCLSLFVFLSTLPPPLSLFNPLSAVRCLNKTTAKAHRHCLRTRCSLSRKRR